MKKQITSNTIWENRYSYSRVIVVNNRAYVAGTVAIDENGQIQGKGKPEEQVNYILNKIEKYIVEAGFERKDIVRTRMFVTDIRHSEEMGKVHGEFFKNINPVFSMVEVSALIHFDMLVEIEVDLEKEE